jgi:hypothetical protein
MTKYKLLEGIGLIRKLPAPPGRPVIAPQCLSMHYSHSRLLAQLVAKQT